MQVQTLDRRPGTAALAPVRDTQVRSTSDRSSRCTDANRFGAALWPPAPCASIRPASRKAIYGTTSGCWRSSMSRVW